MIHGQKNIKLSKGVIFEHLIPLCNNYMSENFNRQLKTVFKVDL